MTMELDGFTGAILAVEGIVGSTAILHGPIGCKYYQSYLAEAQFTRPGGLDLSDLRELGFFGQARVPCDYLDGRDYINGGSEKLEEVLPIVAKRRSGLLAIISSPGAALIGDDIAQSVKRLDLSDRTVWIDMPSPSCPASEGFEDAMIAVLEGLRPGPRARRKHAVNLLGLSIMHKSWEGTVRELTRSLSLMGIEVRAAVGSGCTIDDLRSAGEAELNMVLCPEYGRRTAEWLSKELGTPYLLPPMGAPIGFTATEAWLRATADRLDADPSPAIADLRSARQRARGALERYNVGTGLPKGATFSIRAESSIALPLTEWLVNYLNMWPEAIELVPGSDARLESDLRAFMACLGGDEALDRKVLEEEADLVFASGHEVSLLHSRGMCRAGIALTMPDRRTAELVPRTRWGTTGSLQILEDIINVL